MVSDESSFSSELIQAYSPEEAIEARVTLDTVIGSRPDGEASFHYPSGAYYTNGSTISLEDMTGLSDNDYDYDDWFWGVALHVVGRPKIKVSASPEVAAEGG